MAVPPGSRGESAYRFQPELLALARYPNLDFSYATSFRSLSEAVNG
jgi:hypothetical protein